MTIQSLPEGCYAACTLDDEEEVANATAVANDLHIAIDDLIAVNNHDFCDRRFYESSCRGMPIANDLNFKATQGIRPYLINGRTVYITANGEAGFVARADITSVSRSKPKMEV